MFKSKPPVLALNYMYVHIYSSMSTTMYIKLIRRHRIMYERLWRHLRHFIPSCDLNTMWRLNVGKADL